MSPTASTISATTTTLSKEEIKSCHVYVLRAFLKTHDKDTEGNIQTLRKRALALVSKDDTEDLSTMSVKQLQEKCKTVGRPIYGTKQNLIERFLAKGKETETPIPKDLVATDEDTETSAEEETDDVVMTDETGNVLTPESTKVKKRKHSEKDEAGWVQNGKQTPPDDDSDKSIATQRTDNPNPKIRVGLQLSTGPSPQEPDKALFLATKEWFKKMKEEDPNFRVLPWKGADSKKLPPIKKFEEIPNSVGKYRSYFNRAQIKPKGGPTHMDVFIQHSVPMQELIENVDWFLQSRKARIFNKTIQAESISQMGWLLYSYGSLDIPVLAKAISEQIGATVGLRYKFINTATYESDKDRRKKWMAVHVEADTLDLKKAHRGLKQLYGVASTSFPLGIRMRLVAEFREVKGNPANSGKHNRLRVRQSNFLSMIEGCPNDDICDLDWKEPKLKNKSLRDLIMSIKSNVSTTPGTLFHGVGQDWKGRFVFTYLSNKSKEAAMIADGIIPYLIFHHGNDVVPFFDIEAVKAKEDWHWDDEQKCIINPLSRELDELEEGDQDYRFSAVAEEAEVIDLAAAAEPSTPLTAQELALSRMNVLINEQDADSVSTLGHSPRRRQIPTSLINNTPGVSSATSISTAATFESRLSTMESTMEDFKVSIQTSFQESIRELLANLPQANSAQPPGGALAGGDIG